MKPTRNHIYCPSCGREKMFFASQAKADAFIRYNSGKILEETGKAPVRSYYCALCCGYHVTSNPSAEDARWLDSHDKAIGRMLDRAATPERSLDGKPGSPFAAMIENAKVLMSELRLEEAQAQLDSALCDIRLEMLNRPGWSRGRDLIDWAELCLKTMQRYRNFLENPTAAEEFLNAETVGWQNVLLRDMLNHT